MYATYYYYVPVEYKKTSNTSENGYPYIEVSKFKREIMPPFLEGQVRAMKLLNTTEAKDLHLQVKASELFDNKLNMYKLNGDLSKMPAAIGRARAFTPGWLENGSIWLHMEYKYLLELLKSGLYEEFYQSLQNCLIPFNDPEIYGRSILENSSFIMSSSNPDKKNHGRGYVARLSGSTAEFLNIWSIMVYGTNPFKLDSGNLIFKPEPTLKAEFFTNSVHEIILQDNEIKEKYEIPENSFACCLLGDILLVYHSPKRKDIYPTSATISCFNLETRKGKVIAVNMSYLPNKYVSMIRSGKIKVINVYFS